MTDPIGVAELELELRSLGSAIAVPIPRAGFAAAVMERIEREAPRRERPPFVLLPRVRRSLVLAVAATLIVVAVAAAAIGFNLPGIRIIFGPPPSLEPTGTPHATGEGLPGSLMGLGAIVSVEEAQAVVDFALLQPTDPELGPPDATYVRLGRVAFLWSPREGIPPTDDPEVGLLLNQFRGVIGENIVDKIANEGTHVEPVTVDGAPGYWIAGAPHFFMYVDPSGQEIPDSYRSVSQTLVWTRGGITYRLETALERDAAIRLAESLR